MIEIAADNYRITQNKMNPIRYHCGTEAMVGDIVDFDGMRSVVESIIATKEEFVHWGLDKPGLMYTNEEMGCVFESADSICWSENHFIRRRAE